jgi:ParB family chromosome partitioning protein
MGVMEKMFREAMGLAKEVSSLGQGLTLPLTSLRTHAQPRRYFGSLEELAESIRRQGILQPLLVRPVGEGHYEIVAGERRYRAAQMVGLSEVPVHILEISEHEARLLALVENLQREDLNPYEETLGLLDLLSQELSRSREEVVTLLHQMRNERRGKSTHNVMGNPETMRVEEIFRVLGRMTWESSVQNRLPLLRLPEDLREALEAGTISYTVALELKKVKDGERRAELLEEVKAGLSLRDLKTRVRDALQKGRPVLIWHREAAKKLAKLDLDRLPAEKRVEVEERLRALLEVLE